ncbi:MAG: ABC transporter permease [Thermoplasmata archaeon]|nr:ABC transporter permease [Thermoplasmata archaeon]
MLKESKPGIAGLSIIFAFAFTAIFAPWLAPYDPAFIAPAEDMFSIERIEMEYPIVEGYHSVVIGPTTPGESAMDGGMWFILANEDGTIQMDYTQRAYTEGPFDAGNMSLELDISDYGLDLPLSQIHYVAPARGYNSSTSFASSYGEKIEAGLLTFMANSTFVILDPFTETILFQDDIDFIPVWMNVDTTSSGDMFNPPSQKKVTDIWFSYLHGPYRYVNLANETRIISYEFEYCWNERGIDDVRRMLDKNISITQEPLAYTFDNPKYRDEVTGIYVPSVNGTIHFFNTSTNGTPDSVFDFNISDEPVQFTAPVGYFRSPDATPKLYIPTAVGDEFSMKIFDVSSKSLLGEFNGQGAQIDITPFAAIDGSSYVTLNYYSGAIPVNSTVFNIDGQGIPSTSFMGTMKTLAVTVFSVREASLVYALDTEGVVWASQTTFSVDTPYTDRGMKEIFFTGSKDAQLMYFGSFGGTKYSTTMTSVEMYNMFYNPETDTMIIFQSIGTSLGALPPGTYPSGNYYPLGTDNVGHDILTHLIYGSRVALFVGLTAAFFSVVVGTLVGLVSGYYGGHIDTVLMRITDIALTIPFLPIVLIWSQIQGQSIWNIVIILALLGWPGIARVVRAQTLSLKERAFIDAAQVSGSSDTKIILKHLAPNVMPFTFLYMTLFVAGAILTEAALSYLGLGDPKAISWGNMLSTIQTSGHSLIAPWWMLPPGLAITFLSLGFYLVGRGVDEIVNPRLRRR